MRDLIHITGHKNPDTDSIAASIALAELKKKQGINAIACRIGDINPETDFVLKKFKVEEPKFIANAKVKLYDLETLSLKEMHDAVVMSKVILLGSPTINKTMVKPMWDLFSVIDPMANQGKIAGVFGSYGWSGEGITMAESMLKAMMFKMPIETLKKKFFPSEDTLSDCVEFGKEFAKLVK